MGAVVVHGAAANDGQDGVAVGQRIVKALQHDEGAAVAADGTGGLGVERSTVAIGRVDGAFLVEVPPLLEPRSRAAGQAMSQSPARSAWQAVRVAVSEVEHAG